MAETHFLRGPLEQVQRPLQIALVYLAAAKEIPGVVALGIDLDGLPRA